MTETMHMQTTGVAEEREVMTAAADWLRSGKTVALATVIRTWGSSPRPPGSLLAMNKDGQFVGSVSGGCVEQALLESYRCNELSEPFPTIVDYGIDRLQAGRLGLPCGGRLELLIEQLESVKQLDLLLEQLREGELVARHVCLNSGEVNLSSGDQRVEFSVSDEAVIKIFGPTWHLLLIGDGQLARYLATIARLLDYRVTICDPREEFADPFPLPDVTYSRQMPDDIVHSQANQPRTAVVALAHDPKQDDLALTAALESKAFYVGALGSTRSAAARHKRLLKMGFTTEQMQRLHGPVGLTIGSKRPSEIAVSIIAEITAVRNGVIDALSTAIAEER